MTKKHFIELADTLRDLKRRSVPTGTDGALMIEFEEVVSQLVRFCCSQNYRFNEGTFRGYLDGTCGPSGGAVKPKRVA